MTGFGKDLLIPLGAMAAGLIFTGAIFYFWRADRVARESGQTVEATVVKKFRRGGGLENYYGVFEFIDAHGIKQSLEMNVPSRAWHSLSEGETTQITYVATQPEKSGVGPLWGKKLIGFLLLFMMAVGSGLTLTAAVLLVKEIARALL